MPKPHKMINAKIDPDDYKTFNEKTKKVGMSLVLRELIRMFNKGEVKIIQTIGG